MLDPLSSPRSFSGESDGSLSYVADRSTKTVAVKSPLSNLFSLCCKTVDADVEFFK